MSIFLYDLRIIFLAPMIAVYEKNLLKNTVLYFLKGKGSPVYKFFLDNILNNIPKASACANANAYEVVFLHQRLAHILCIYMTSSFEIPNTLAFQSGIDSNLSSFFSCSLLLQFCNLILPLALLLLETIELKQVYLHFAVAC